MSEKEYRELVLTAFKKLERAFDAVDPDKAEFEMAQGAVTIVFADRSKLILSQQPSLRQIWVAAAAKGIAYHLDYDLGLKKWMDDKGKGVELFGFIQQTVEAQIAVHLSFSDS